jgi:Excalibur calcium-binding domain
MWSLRRTVLVICVTVVLPVFTVAAQDDFEDRNRFCPLVSPELAKAIADSIKGGGRCEVWCSGCGCKGGPGFREIESQQCVSWSDLISKCGPPPHPLCTAECEPVKATCPGRAWVKEVARDANLAVQFIEGKERPKKAKRAKKKSRSKFRNEDQLNANPDAETLACTGKTACEQMTSCSEAEFYLKECLLQGIDEDGDGIPCSGLCPSP